MPGTYRLTDREIKAVARLCWQEQGSVMGAAAEASLICNRYRLYGEGYTSPYDYARNSGWFARAAYWMDNGDCEQAVIDLVSDALSGQSYLPPYIDEHDCLSDIVSISTGNKNVKGDYIRGVTVIKNVYDSEYIFYGFPSVGSDPFGYTRRGYALTAIDKATAWMEDLALDNSHGYSQEFRWGPDYDCSSATIKAWQTAGVPLTCTYTGDMRSDMISKGFEDVTARVNLSTGEGLARGDVLLNEVHHVAMYCGDGKEVEASVNEKGGATGGDPGDQTGKEILIRSYRNYPWNCVLRYTAEPKTLAAVKNATVSVPYARLGCTGAGVTLLQTALNLLTGAGLVADGEFGAKTDAALKAYQTGKGIEATGLCGKGTFRRIMVDVANQTWEG